MPTTNYVWDPLNDSYLMETDGAGATTAVYTQEPSRYGGLASQRRSDITTYTHQDNLGNTRTLTNDNGIVSDTFTYDAWGNELERTGMTNIPFRWIGQIGYYVDAEAGTLYIRARTYRSTEAAWTSIDPHKFTEGANNYKYAQNGPTRFIDASGRISAEFSRPTDDPSEFLDQADRFRLPDPWKVQIDPNRHEPWETARIQVSVTADTSKCRKGICETTTNPSGFKWQWPCCCGYATLKFKYEATLKSFNPSSDDNPATIGGMFGIEVQGASYFFDPYYPLRVTPGAGPGPIGSKISGEATSRAKCDQISQEWYIRTAVDIWFNSRTDQIFKYSRSPDGCSNTPVEERLTGRMSGSRANGPLRQIPPDQPYPPSPFYRD
ncbi:MAG: RHS repeat-associated core domain-containing protein [Planctomycetota bacterium]